MKNIFIAVTFFVTAQLSAFPMFCKGTKGYQVSVNEKGSQARVTRNGKPVMFGGLNCTTVHTAEVRPEGDAVLTCWNPERIADAGLSVYVYRPHGTEDYVGRLTTQSIAGPRLLTKLACVRAMN